ncbi:hypothetical protein WJX81_002803 [Elliptochloris bilobata]|uniref:F-box domain-containing protein n=1 Tax=Elliptochloris bilobata TaxID=381761 RepID=A0AAW1S880_9CHLO
MPDSAAERMPRAVQSGRLEDLDDGCLLEVLKHLTPLPDLFCTSRVNRRFRRLASDTRLWKLVTGAATPADAAGGRRLAGRHGRRAYPTLQAAVAASRPGDTIELEAAQVHEAADIAVRWPVRLRGGGAAPEDTVLLCPAGADAALVFSASGVLGNLSVHSGAIACLVHHRGRVMVQGCVLTCHAAPGLGHLFAPLVTLAWNGRGLLPPDGGVLTVVETRILGSAGSQAVRAAGSGVLRGVFAAWWTVVR